MANTMDALDLLQAVEGYVKLELNNDKTVFCLPQSVVWDDDTLEKHILVWIYGTDRTDSRNAVEYGLNDIKSFKPVTEEEIKRQQNK